MNEQEWKLKITEELATIKTDVKYILRKLPNCQYPVYKKQIETQKKLIYIILTSFIPMVVGLFIALHK